MSLEAILVQEDDPAQLNDFFRAASKFESLLIGANIPLLQLPIELSARGVKSVGRTSLRKVHVPDMSTFVLKYDKESRSTSKIDQGDLHATPLGLRMIFDQYRTGYPERWYKNFVCKWFPEKLWDVLLYPYLLYKVNDHKVDGKLLMPRGYHSVWTEHIEVPYYPVKSDFRFIEWKGIIEHVKEYAIAAPSVPDEIMDEFKQFSKEVQANNPVPDFRWDSFLVSKEWISNIKTDANSGYPYYIRQNSYVIDLGNDKLGVVKKDNKSQVSGTLMRDWLFNKYFDLVYGQRWDELPKEVMYTLFYRSQWKKDRGVMGAPAYLKVYGAAMNSIALKVNADPIRSQIAWGSPDKIREGIYNAFQTYKDGCIISVDFSGLDSTFSHEYMKIIFGDMKEQWIQKDPAYGTALDYLVYTMTDGAYLVVSPRRYFKVIMGMLSGTPATQWGDTELVKTCARKMRSILQYHEVPCDFFQINLGDDVFWVGPKELSTYFTEWVDWVSKLGLVVNKEKSFIQTVKDGFGVFLQKVYYINEKTGKPNYLGVLGRNLCSEALKERDSSALKSFDSERYEAENTKPDYKILWLLRTLQILASMQLDNMPKEAALEMITFLRRYDKYLSSKSACEEALRIGAEYATDLEFWHSSVDPKNVMKFLGFGV